MYSYITIVIPSYKSGKLIISHLKKISKKINVIIIENSKDKRLKKEIETKYKNVRVYLQNNIGYGNAINYGSKFVKTKYFFVMNPDTIIYKNTIKKLLIAAKKIKHFGALSPDQIKNKKINLNKKKKIIEKKKLDGGAMLFETRIFKHIEGFDENIFLYYEENDFFHKCNNLNLKLYLIRNCFFYHSKKGDSSSAIYKNSKEKFYSYLIGGWHGQWSKFYYLKKYHGFIYALMKCLPNLIVNFVQLLIKGITLSKKTKYLYFKIEGLISSIIGIRSYKRSKFDK
jgi:N-acetylglucosaminyl-diphospho-decaprenol L-rhamnosyltransferase